LRPVSGTATEVSDDSRRLKDDWLRQTLGDLYVPYSAAAEEEKADILIGLLRAIGDGK
jgi:hypothetical protein